MTLATMALKTAKWAATFALTITGCAAVGLYWYQCKLVYPNNFPEDSRTNVVTPYEAYKIPYTEVTLTTPDSVRLRAYVILAKPIRERIRISELQGKSWPNKKKVEEGEEAGKSEGMEVGEDYAKGRPTVLMYHANAGNMGHRLAIARKFWFDMGCNVAMLSYRGYGKSEGSPSEKGLRIDAQTALDYVTNHSVLKNTKIILYGQSIGSSVAIATAAHNPSLSALIIENSPLSLSTLVPLIIPYLAPFVRLPYLLTERWDAEISLPMVRKDMPMLMLAGAKDELVLPVQMKEIRKLREKAGGKVKFVEFKDGTHNDTYTQPGYWDEVDAFIREEVLEDKALQ